MTYTIEVYYEKPLRPSTIRSFDNLMEDFGVLEGHAVEGDPHRRRWIVDDRALASRLLQYLHSPMIRAAMWENVNLSTEE